MQNLTAAKFPEASFPTANLFTANFPRTDSVIFAAVLLISSNVLFHNNLS